MQCTSVQLRTSYLSKAKTRRGFSAFLINCQNLLASTSELEHHPVIQLWMDALTMHVIENTRKPHYYATKGRQGDQEMGDLLLQMYA